MDTAPHLCIRFLVDDDMPSHHEDRQREFLLQYFDIALTTNMNSVHDKAVEFEATNKLLSLFTSGSKPVMT